MSFQSLLCSEDRHVSQAWWLLSCRFQSSVVGVMPFCSWQLRNSFPPPVPLPEVRHFCVTLERNSLVSGLTPGRIHGAHLPEGCHGPPGAMLPLVCLRSLLSALFTLSPFLLYTQGGGHSQPAMQLLPEQPLPTAQPWPAMQLLPEQPLPTAQPWPATQLLPEQPLPTAQPWPAMQLLPEQTTAHWSEQHPLPTVRHVGRKTLIDFEWLHHFYQNGRYFHIYLVNAFSDYCLLKILNATTIISGKKIVSLSTLNCKSTFA